MYRFICNSVLIWGSESIDQPLNLLSPIKKHKSFVVPISHSEITKRSFLIKGQLKHNNPKCYVTEKKTFMSNCMYPGSSFSL